MYTDRASLLACLLAISNVALATPGELSTAFSGSLATANASGEGRGGAICSRFNPDIFNGAILEKEIDAEAWRTQLEQQLMALPVAAGRHSVSGSVSVVKADICWPYYGLYNLDKIKGSVSLSVAWKVDGVDITTTATHTRPKNGPGGLRGMLLAAYTENLRQLLSNPELAMALATPEKIIEPVAQVVPEPEQPPPSLPVATPQPARASVPQPPQPKPAAASPAASPAAASSPAPSKASGAAMTFLMQVSVDTIINRMNGTCYSNLITIPGPPGWPVLDHTNDKKAAALVDAYKAGFLAQCAQAGPVRSGNFSYIWNARGSEGRLADEYARQQRNRMFQVQVSP